MGKGLPVNTLVGDPSSTNHLSDPNNPWIIGSLKTWNEIVKRYQLRKKTEMFKWFANDPDCIPNKYDTRFKGWIGNGLTAYCTLLDKDTVRSFQDLKDKFGLQNQDHFRYLQIRDFVKKKFPTDVTSGREEILNIFQRAYENATFQKIISKLYLALQNLKSDHTLYIKQRWETEGSLTLSQEEWDRICKQQWTVTSSPS